ncbi:MAG TPA: four helix bundle protein [Gemmatimonadaceae bacterium]|nr:four helix bundle protein [Gemmatimonadaceae bacterium]
MQDYRNLDVVDRAHDHAIRIRKVTNTFPRTGFAEFKSQLTTAAESIPFNIVEGCGAESNIEFARFLRISIKSAFELEYQLKLARDYEVLPESQWEPLTKETVEIRKMTCGLRKAVLGKKKPDAPPGDEDEDLP